MIECEYLKQLRIFIFITAVQGLQPNACTHAMLQAGKFCEPLLKRAARIKKITISPILSEAPSASYYCHLSLVLTVSVVLGIGRS